MPIKNIIFDLGNVIVDINPQKTIEAFKKIFLKTYESSWNELHKDGILLQYETGKISSESFINAIQRLKEPVPDALEIISAWNAIIVGVPQDRIDYLRKLARRYNLFVLSNTSAMHIHHINAIMQAQSNCTLESLFKTCFYSYGIGHVKPDKAAFESVISRLNIIPAETLFIDDLLENCKTGKRMGFKVIHHDFREKEIWDYEILCN